MARPSKCCACVPRCPNATGAVPWPSRSDRTAARRCAEQLEAAIEDAAERLLLPAIERDVRRALTDRAETHAIGVFGGEPARAAHPAAPRRPDRRAASIPAFGPAARSRWSIRPAKCSKRRRSIHTRLSSSAMRRAGRSRRSWRRTASRSVAIGNGTASRETEQLVAELTRWPRHGSHYLMVSEAGASVYSASPLARAELPDLDVTLRGAVSIARRAQDPLAELVKIDPQAIGVGMYQHDVDQGVSRRR